MHAVDQLEFGLELVVRVTQPHRRELLQTLEGLHGAVTDEWGAVACDVLEDALAPNRFFWLEWWPSASAVEAALASERFAMLLAAARLLGSVEALRQIHAKALTGSAGPS